MKKKEITDEDMGAALMKWYAESIEQYPKGLITQAQAATILGISRVAISRLINRGHINAVYFPKPPEVEGIAVGYDDPTWIKIIGWLGMKIGYENDGYTWPKACYVSFEDVQNLWLNSDARQKCKINWFKLLFTSDYDGEESASEDDS